MRPRSPPAPIWPVFRPETFGILEEEILFQLALEMKNGCFTICHIYTFLHSDNMVTDYGQKEVVREQRRVQNPMG